MAGLWFKFWANTHLTDGDIDRLTAEGERTYIRIKCLCSLEGCAPVDPVELARKTRLTESEVRRVLPEVANLFHNRCGKLFDKEQERQDELSEKRSRAGTVAVRKKGARDGGGRFTGLPASKQLALNLDANRQNREEIQKARNCDGDFAPSCDGGFAPSLAPTKKLEVRSKKLEASAELVSVGHIPTVVEPVDSVENVENSHRMPAPPGQSEIEKRRALLKQQVKTVNERKTNGHVQSNGHHNRNGPMVLNL